MGADDKAIRGVPWTLASVAVSRAVTLAGTVVLARLLTPEDFGLVALAALVLGVGSLATELGLGSAIVVDRELTDATRTTIFTLMLAGSVVMAGVLAATSPLWADLFQTDALAPVLAALAVTLVLNAVARYHEATLQRDLEFRRRFVAQLAYALAWAAIGVAAAAAGAGVWALVAAGVAGSAVAAAVLAARRPISLGVDRRAAGRSLRSGRGFALQGALAWLKQNADYLSVGRVLGAAPLGGYSLAYRLSDLPYQAIGDPVAKVTFPAFARMRREAADPGDRFLSVLQMVAVCACPLALMLSATADPLTRAVFGERWEMMIGPLAVLGVWGAVRVVHASTGWLLNAMQMAGLLAAVSAVLLAGMVPALFLAAASGGLTAVAYVMLAEMVLGELILAHLVSRRAGVSMARQWRALRPAVAAGVPLWVGARLVVELTAGAPPGVSLVAAIGAGAAVYLAVIRLAAPGLAGRVKELAARSLRRRSVEPAGGS